MEEPQEHCGIRELEPAVRVELTTPALRKLCSAIEPRGPLSPRSIPSANRPSQAHFPPLSGDQGIAELQRR